MMLISLILVAPTFAVQLGDPAPEISVASWVRGGPVAESQENKAIILEFWATWCGPCVDSIPHLSSLQAEHASDLQVIGITADADESSALIQRFANRNDMDYHVAMDKESQTWDSYMSALQLDGIPTSFLIDRDGHLVWYGHPSEIDEPLQNVLSPLYDRAQSVASFSLVAMFDPALSEGRYEEAGRIAQQGINATTGTTKSTWIGKLMVAQSQQFGQTDEIVENAERLLQSEVLAETLNIVSWQISNNQQSDQKILASMQELSRRAVAMSEGTNSDYLDTYARILFYSGNIPAAIIAEEEALRQASSKAERQWYKATIKAYKNGTLP